MTASAMTLCRIICVVLMCLFTPQIQAETTLEAGEADLALDLLRETMLSVQSLKAEYTSTLTTPQGDGEIQEDGLYVRQGDYYNFQRAKTDSKQGRVRIERVAVSESRWQSMVGAANEGGSFTGSVREPIALVLQTPPKGDLLELAGFGVAKPRFEQLREVSGVELISKEVLGDRTRYQVALNSPYRGDTRVLNYYWIDVVGEKARLSQYAVYLDGDVNRPLLEKRFEYHNGQCFPSSISHVKYRESEEGTTQVFSREVNFHTVAVNPDVSEEDLRFEFPHGTIVSDRITGLTYTVGDDRIHDENIAQFAEEVIADAQFTDTAQPESDLNSPSGSPAPGSALEKKIAMVGRKSRGQVTKIALGGIGIGLALIGIAITRRLRKRTSIVEA